jgi:hypothetical protein
VQINQSTVKRESLCLARGSAEPALSIEQLENALRHENIEELRPLMPVGYQVAAEAYKKAVSGLTVEDLSGHYRGGLDFFHSEFVPHLKTQLEELSGGQWSLDDFEAFAAGSDVDFMTHIVEAVAAQDKVSLYPGGWYGFLVGTSQRKRIQWTKDSGSSLACLCVPSVRNGHLTEDMASFLDKSEHCLLNLNLFPTMPREEREAVARSLEPVLNKSILSISFSRGFGLTASQLGVVLVRKGHPYLARYTEQWRWLTYFYNAIAARAFMEIDFEAMQRVDNERRGWVKNWLEERGLPAVETGSYYVKCFRFSGVVPEFLKPLQRGDVLRLCLKPPIY